MHEVFIVGICKLLELTNCMKILIYPWLLKFTLWLTIIVTILKKQARTLDLPMENTMKPYTILWRNLKLKRIFTWKKHLGSQYSPGKMFNFNFKFQCAEGWVYHSKGYEVDKKEAVFHFLLPLQSCLKSKEKLSCQSKKIHCKPFPLWEFDGINIVKISWWMSIK